MPLLSDNLEDRFNMSFNLFDVQKQKLTSKYNYPHWVSYSYIKIKDLKKTPLFYTTFENSHNNEWGFMVCDNQGKQIMNEKAMIDKTWNDLQFGDKLVIENEDWTIQINIPTKSKWTYKYDIEKQELIKV